MLRNHDFVNNLPSTQERKSLLRSKAVTPSFDHKAYNIVEKVIVIKFNKIVRRSEWQGELYRSFAS